MRWPRLKTRRCRALTPAERHMASSVFGSGLEVNSVRLCEHDLVLPGYAVSPNGHVYFHTGELPSDFGLESVNKQAWLIHELTHVWQVQQGVKVFRRALFNRTYAYKLIQGRSFLSYGVEQQAKMVEDFYRKRALKQDCSELQSCLPKQWHIQKEERV